MGSYDNPSGLRASCVVKASEVPLSAAFLVTVNPQVVNDIDVTISAGGASEYKLNLWLVDVAADPNTMTLSPPTGDNTVQWMKITDSAGNYTHTITHTGAAQTWYMVVALGAEVVISDAITFAP